MAKTMIRPPSRHGTFRVMPPKPPREAPKEPPPIYFPDLDPDPDPEPWREPPPDIPPDFPPEPPGQPWRDPPPAGSQLSKAVDRQVTGDNDSAWP